MTLKFDSIIFFFLITVVIGPAVGYSHLYIFHVVLVFLCIIWLLLNVKRVRIPLYIPKTRLVYFPFFMLVWYGLSLCWSINFLYTLRYLVYIILGISIVYVISVYSNTIQKYEAVFKVLKGIFILEIIIALLEVYTSFRLPTSPYSHYAVLFARKGTDFSVFSDEVVNIIKSTPTAFLGNPNNLSVVMVTILPYFLFSKRIIVKIFGVASILIIVLYTGSRGCFIAIVFGFILILLIKWPFRFAGFTTLVVLIFLLILPNINIDMLKNSRNKRISELSYTGDRLFAYVFKKEEGKGSIAIRQQLVANGLDALWNTFGLGVGGGGSQAVQEMHGGVEGKFTSMHNFWIEILVDAGVLFFASFVVWYICIIYKLYMMFKKSKETFFKYHACSLFVAFGIFSVACISASSVIYLLPMWIMFGMSIALINIRKQYLLFLNCIS